VTNNNKQGDKTMTQQEYYAEVIRAAKAGECPVGMTEEQWEWVEMSDVLDGLAENRKASMLAELEIAEKRGVKRVWYGHIENAEPVKIHDAIADIERMDPDVIGEGTWGEWPEDDM